MPSFQLSVPSAATNSPKLVARTLGMTENAVRIQLLRFRKRCKEILRWEIAEMVIPLTM